MILVYILLVAYILAVNFYAFLLVKSIREKENDTLSQQNVSTEQPTPTPQKTPEKFMSKLFITGLLGGAITIYVCTFIFKWKRSELLIMVAMPLLGVLNVYLWVLLFRSGFSFLAIR